MPSTDLHLPSLIQRAHWLRATLWPYAQHIALQPVRDLTPAYAASSNSSNSHILMWSMEQHQHSRNLRFTAMAAPDEHIHKCSFATAPHQDIQPSHASITLPASTSTAPSIPPEHATASWTAITTGGCCKYPLWCWYGCGMTCTLSMDLSEAV